MERRATARKIAMPAGEMAGNPSGVAAVALTTVGRRELPNYKI